MEWVMSGVLLVLLGVGLRSFMRVISGRVPPLHQQRGDSCAGDGHSSKQTPSQYNRCGF